LCAGPFCGLGFESGLWHGGIVFSHNAILGDIKLLLPNLNFKMENQSFEWHNKVYGYKWTNFKN